MMEICSEAVDLQTAKLNEFVLVAHKIRKVGRSARPGLSKSKLRPKNAGGARASSPTGKKNLLAANGSIDPTSPELCEAPAKLISLHSRETICKEGRIASSEQANSIALQDRSRLQQTSKEAQALLLRSDGGPRGELLQRSSSPNAPLDVAAKLPKSKIESSIGLRTPQANSIALQDRMRFQQTSKEAQALLLRSDGGPRGELFQRSSSTSASLDVVTKLPESKIKCSDGPRTHQVPPKGSSPHPRKSDLFSASTGLGRGSRTRKLLQPGNRRGKTSPLPEQKHRK
jgi:hypothetical protein